MDPSGSSDNRQMDAPPPRVIQIASSAGITSATRFSHSRTPVCMENAKKPPKSRYLEVHIDPYWFMLWAPLHKMDRLDVWYILTHQMGSETIRNYLNR